MVGTFSARTNILYCAMFFFAGGLIYLYREDLAGLLKNCKWIFFTVCALVILCFYGVDQSVYTMLILFSLMLVCGIGIDRETNWFVKFISSISMEIYLCHMAIFRVIEKAKLLHLYSSDVLSYLTAAVLTIVGAVLFASAAKRGIELLGEISGRVRKHDEQQRKRYMDR